MAPAYMTHVSEANFWRDMAHRHPRSEGYTSDYWSLARRCITAAKRCKAITKAALAAEYVSMIGYDPFVDDPKATVAEVQQTLREYRAERFEGTHQ